MKIVVGVDGGGTKTLAVVAGTDGGLLGVGSAGGSNFQACGVAGAASQCALAVQRALREAALGPSEIDAACYAMAGADRPKDFAVVEGFTRSILPAKPTLVVNDSIAALRAGTPDGVGIAVVAGTGTNAVGRAADGRMLQVGGLGRLSGDWGSAWQLGEAAVVASMMAEDGRGADTVLRSMICRKLGLEGITDIVEYEFYDHPGPPLDLGSLAPLVFEAADGGDGVARGILREAGRRQARCVEVLVQRLFGGNDDVTVVLGGSVFQKPQDGTLVGEMKAALERLSRLRFVRLKIEPVLGAVALACDLVLPGGGMDLVNMLDSRYTGRRAGNGDV